MSTFLLCQPPYLPHTPTSPGPTPSYAPGPQPTHPAAIAQPPPESTTPFTPYILPPSIPPLPSTAPPVTTPPIHPTAVPPSPPGPPGIHSPVVGARPVGPPRGCRPGTSPPRVPPWVGVPSDLPLPTPEPPSLAIHCGTARQPLSTTRRGPAQAARTHWRPGWRWPATIPKPINKAFPAVITPEVPTEMATEDLGAVGNVDGGHGAGAGITSSLAAPPPGGILCHGSPLPPMEGGEGGGPLLEWSGSR
jgi:hypothetical protein